VEEFRYTDDIKESIALADKLARKAWRSAMDRDYLQGLLLTHRKFNRLDALLTELNVSPVHLRSELTKSKGDPKDSHILKQAAQFAKESHNGASGPATVDVEHVMKALCLSSDPALQQVFQAYHISPERIEQSLHGIKSKQFQRTALFVGKELLEVIGFVLAFLILIKSFLGELRLIPSESMVPGLQINDRLVIERVTHWVRPYHRGDILVFYPPMTRLGTDPWSVFMRITGFSGLVYKKEDNIDVAYIKRLIGLPGDTVDVRPGIGVFVNGQKLNEPYVNEVASTCTLVCRGPAYCTSGSALLRPEPQCGPVKVPEGSYYMMGDNRNLSLDSRYWGFAKEDRVIGRAVFRIWPLNRISILHHAPNRH
jgi:signal peptidase I